MKRLLILPFFTFAGVSCSNPAAVEESDRKNIYQAQFFYEQGFPGKALEKASQVKESSPRYGEARDWIDRIEGEALGPGYH